MANCWFSKAALRPHTNTPTINYICICMFNREWMQWMSVVVLVSEHKINKQILKANSAQRVAAFTILHKVLALRHTSIRILRSRISFRFEKWFSALSCVSLWCSFVPGNYMFAICGILVIRNPSSWHKGNWCLQHENDTVWKLFETATENERDRVKTSNKFVWKWLPHKEQCDGDIGSVVVNATKLNKFVENAFCGNLEEMERDGGRKGAHKSFKWGEANKTLDSNKFSVKEITSSYSILARLLRTTGTMATTFEATPR